MHRAVLGIFIWVGQSKAKQNLGRPTEVVYMGIMGMTRAVWVGQERVWIGHGLPGLIARIASDTAERQTMEKRCWRWTDLNACDENDSGDSQIERVSSCGRRVEVLVPVEVGNLLLELGGRGARRRAQHDTDRHRYQSAVDVAPEPAEVRPA